MAAVSAGKVAFVSKGDYDAETTYAILDFVYYEGSTYVAKATTVGNAPTDTTYWQILAKGTTGVSYGTSDTAGATAAKVVTTVNQDFSLEQGADVVVKFANNDTAGNITLNVDGTGAVTALLEGSAIGANFLNSDTAYEFVYDGTNFLLMNGGGSVAANNVSYDNTNSGLNATTAQGAIDEITTMISGVTYDETTETITIPNTIASYADETITFDL